jgi:ABC-type glutathione transport system ATPase component
VGYFAQDHREILDDPNATPIAIMQSICPTEPEAAVRGRLGRLLFSGSDIYKKVELLSGGEAARLLFCSILAREPNVLLLDEPTNHLDVEAIEALAEALCGYEGTTLFVSHDRWFVAKVASRVLEVTPSGPNDFPGTYDEYLQRCGDDHLDADAVARKAKDAKQASSAATLPLQGAAWDEQKKKRNRIKELPARRDKVMATIDVAEARKKEIEALYCSDGFFEKTSKADLTAFEREQKELDERVLTLMEEWEALEKEISEASP